MKQRSPVVSTLLSLLVTLIGGGIYFYIAIPALNPKSFDFYLFLIVLCVLYMLAKFLFSSEDSQSGKKKKEPKQTILEPDGKGQRLPYPHGHHRPVPAGLRGGQCHLCRALPR